jgi:hypothetical protein
VRAKPDQKLADKKYISEVIGIERFFRISRAGTVAAITDYTSTSARQQASTESSAAIQPEPGEPA